VVAGAVLRTSSSGAQGTEILDEKN
jgi:hypothetical protein